MAPYVLLIHPLYGEETTTRIFQPGIELPISLAYLSAYLEDKDVAKLAVEQELRISHNLFDLNYIIFRLYNVYGERQNIGDRYRNVIGIFMNQIMENEPLIIFGDGTQTRAFTYIKDVAPLMANSVFLKEAYNQVFDIGADQPIPVNVLSHAVSEAMGVKAEVRYVEEREEVKHAYCSHEKIDEVLNFRASYSLPEGLKSMAEWARKHGSRKSGRFDNIEIQKNLPAVWME